MSLFQTTKSGDAGSPRTEGESRGLSIIGPGMKVTGDVDTDGVVKVEGQVTGTVRASRQVLVAKGGEVEGDIIAPEVILGGEVRGGIQAVSRVEVQATSVIHGDISAPRLLVAEGGQVNGVIRMAEGASARAAAGGTGPRALVAS
jgi:cytoskeletal protein CcmA (bactofilin family)